MSEWAYQGHCSIKEVRFYSVGNGGDTEIFRAGKWFLGYEF